MQYKTEISPFEAKTNIYIYLEFDKAEKSYIAKFTIISIGSLGSLRN